VNLIICKTGKAKLQNLWSK